MAARDPETGQFVSGGTAQYNDIEVVTFGAETGVKAADLDGTSTYGGEANTFEGLEIVDYDDIVDRNEELVLLGAHHRLSVFANSTATADGTVSASVEVSASPSITDPTATVVNAESESFDDSDVVGQGQSDDTIDVLGRPLVATAGAPFTDGANGASGSGSSGEDAVHVSMAPMEFGRFHPRDELFINGKFRSWNIDDQGIHLNVTGQHVYGVLPD